MCCQDVKQRSWERMACMVYILTDMRTPSRYCNVSHAMCYVEESNKKKMLVDIISGLA